MKNIALFYPYVEPHCPGASIPQMKQALLLSALEFCERSNIVQEIATVGTTAGTAEVDVEVPTQQQFVRILSAQYKGDWVYVASTEDAPNVAYELASGTPRAIYLANPLEGVMTLDPVPDTTESNVLFVRASFAPTLSASQVADTLFDSWVEPIAAGAVARLQSTAGNATVSPFASQFRALFERGVGRASVAARRGRIQGSQRVQARAFV